VDLGSKAHDRASTGTLRHDSPGEDRVAAGLMRQLKRSRRREPLQTILQDFRTLAKIAFTSGLAWWLGNLAGQPRPVFAALVPILVIRSDTTATMQGSLGRVIGVLLGVGLGLGALEIHRPSPLLVGGTVGVALVIDRLVRALPHVGLDTRSQTAVSALLMLFVASSVTSYALARVWETAIGGALSLLVDGVDQSLGRWFSHSRPEADRQSAP
jgi:Fusaric acid resistance protein-like